MMFSGRHSLEVICDTETEFLRLSAGAVGSGRAIGRAQKADVDYQKTRTNTQLFEIQVAAEQTKFEL